MRKALRSASPLSVFQFRFHLDVKRILFFFSLVFLNGFASQLAFSDQTKTLQVENSGAKNVQRIVNLAPNLTEFVFELGLEKSLVGVSSECNFPLAAKQIPKVGSYIGLEVKLAKIL